MRKFMIGMLALMMLIGVPFTALGASNSNLSTEQKYDVLRQKNIFTGFADGSSRLYDSMSREQLAAVLFRLLELPAQATSSTSFDDVLKSRWSYQEIEMVNRSGLMTGTKKRTFSPEDNVTVEQLAIIFVRSYGLSGNGSTYVDGRVSKWARSAVSIALDRQLIPQLSDYTVDATRGLLVEAAYAIYEDTHTEPLRIRSVEQLTNQSVRVNLQQWTNDANAVSKSRFTIKDAYGNQRNVNQATLSQDGMSIILWTDRQSPGVIHTLNVDGITWTYMSAQEDTTKPQIVNQPVKLSNRAYEITFSEPVEAKTATNASNYQLNNGLKLNTLQISSDQRRVTFTTSEQSDGKSYQLTVRNVKDLAGNVMDKRSDLYLVGSDNTKPKVTEVKINVSNAIISVKFSEKIDPQHAIQTYHYSIDKGLVVTQATLENDGRTVSLRTSPQQDAVYYSLTVSGIPDLGGNVMDTSSNWKFGAVAYPVTPAKLQSIVAINKNTIEISFNRALTDTDVRNVKLSSLADNGSKMSLSDWKAYTVRKPGSDRTVIKQYRTDRSGNPDLFRTGHVYTAGVTGVAGLETSNNSDQMAFAGTVVDNPIPYVTQVVVLDRNLVKVIFSEPVTRVDGSAFRIREKDGDSVKIAYDELNDRGKVVTEVLLRLGDDLESNRTYAMTFQYGIITDTATWNGLKTAEGSQPYIVYFNT